MCDHDVCVHLLGADAASERAGLDLLQSASSALAGLRALRLPSPLVDVLGGDGRLDVYLDPMAEGPRAFLDAGTASWAFDRGTGFVIAPALGGGCVHRQALARSVAEAMLAGQDAALEPNAKRMLAGHLSVLTAPCAIAEIEAVDTAQRAPERTFTGSLGEPAPASFLFPWFLEDKYGTSEPGKLTVALASISGQKTFLGALVDEPDMFDALRVTQQQNGTSVADTLLEFAVARAFVGSRSDDTHMIDVSRFGDAGRARIEWNVTFASLPRRLAPLRPIEPLGMSYVMVDTSAAAEGSELTLVAEWEAPVAFRWAVVKLDAQGAEIGRQEVSPVLGETKMEKSVRELKGVSHVLIVAMNEGEATRDEPFDPGELREGARSYLLTVYP